MLRVFPKRRHVFVIVQKRVDVAVVRIQMRIDLRIVDRNIEIVLLEHRPDVSETQRKRGLQIFCGAAIRRTQKKNAAILLGRVPGKALPAAFSCFLNYRPIDLR